MEPFDVVVVGAGPAGSTTARFAASGGLSVLLLDKRGEIGHPVQCGEFIPSMEELANIIPRVSNLEELFSLDGQISKRTSSIRIFSPRNRVYEFAFGGFSVERRRFDKHLAELAVAAGAELRVGVKVTGVKGNSVIAGDEEIRARVIVGADGPSSNVGRWVGLIGPTKFSRCVLCEVPGDFPPVVKMFFGNVAPGGYAWIIPKADKANVGLGIQKDGVQLKPLLMDFLKSRGLKEPINFSAGIVPVSGTLARTVKGNVLVVGDAAGHIMATNGGGIPIAMVCGRIAGRTISAHLSKGTPLEMYDSGWRRAVGKELNTAFHTKTLADLVLGRNLLALEVTMNAMGSDRMSWAVKCKSIVSKERRGRLH